MKIVIFLGAVLLAGCGTVPPPTQIVYVPVHTPCVKEVPVAPVFEFDKLPLDASAGEKVLALARDWLRGRKHEAELEAVVTGCATQPPSSSQFLGKLATPPLAAVEESTSPF